MQKILIPYVIGFGRRIAGIITRPYETVRSIVVAAQMWELGAVGACAILYLAAASVVRTSLFRPYMLTRQFVVLLGAAVLSYAVVAGLFWMVGKLIGGKGSLRGFLVGWGYGLIPTTLWFWMTSILYIVLPPPRTDTAKGILFSFFYLVLSVTLLFWKIILSYLALRFSLHLDLKRILVIFVVVLPILFLYSIGMYRLGIFRVPFI